MGDVGREGWNVRESTGRHEPVRPRPRALDSSRATSWSDARLRTGLVLLALLAAGALGAGRLAPGDPRAFSGRPLERPGAAHPLGTNNVGQDLLSALLHGARTSLAIGLAAAGFSTAVAWCAGLLAGIGPRADAAVTTLIDLALALPFLPLAILIVAHVGGRPPVIALTLGLLSWPPFARVIRARVRGELRRGHVEAARALGAGPARIVARHILPATIPLATAKFVLTVQYAVLAEASLAFLGLGDPTTVSWGGTIHRAVGYALIFATDAWRWWLLPPAAAIAVLVSTLALLGWALDEAAEGR